LAARNVLPADRPGPVFRELWHAEAFAMAVELNARGHFSWAEWATTLAGVLRDAPVGGEPEDAYYAAWLTALERLVAAKGLVDEGERRLREAAWDAAARATPHGQPIVLTSARRGSA
jgi:nitrile hydratase accessory protein